MGRKVIGRGRKKISVELRLNEDNMTIEAYIEGSHVLDIDEERALVEAVIFSNEGKRFYQRT
jgi:hypothetical protein